MFDPYNDWRMEMYALAVKDKWCQETARKVAELEPGYLRILSKLSPDEQEILEDYIAACQENKYSLIYPAYELGWQQGRKEH